MATRLVNGRHDLAAGRMLPPRRSASSTLGPMNEHRGRGIAPKHLASRAALALAALAVSCGQSPPISPREQVKAPELQELEERTGGVTREASATLTAREVDRDLDLLEYALERGYGGRPFVPPAAWAEMSRRLRALRGASTTVLELCTQIGDALWQLPDAHLSAKRRSPAERADVRCGTYFARERRRASVGDNYAVDEKKKPWIGETISVGHASFGVLAIKELPFAEDPAWEAFERVVRRFMRADGLVIDLRGNGGGDDARGRQLARWLLDGPIAPGFTRTHERRTPEAFTLRMNEMGALDRGPDGSLPPHVAKRFEAARTERDEAARSTSPEWKIVEAPKPPVTLGPKAYHGPIAILVDAACASSCEGSLQVLRTHPKARVFGERTAGFVHFGEVGAITLPSSGVRVGIPTKYFEYPGGKLYDKVGFDPDVAVGSGASAFEVSMAWMLAEGADTRVVPPAQYVVPAAAREAEAARLAALGLKLPVPEGPVLERPWATPLSRRSLVVPQSWLVARTPRVVHAPSLLADLDALELAMSRAYGGWAVAEKHGWSFHAWFERWRGALRAAKSPWLPAKQAFAPFEEFERFQLDNHTTVPLGVSFGAGSRTVVLQEQPPAACSALVDKSGREIPINPSDPGQAVKAARRFDGERLSPSWYVALPENRGEIVAARCGERRIATTPPKRLEGEALTSSILDLSRQPKDRPFLRHLSERVAYLRLPSFVKANSEIIARERASWEKPNGKEQALIVDLRGNDGGDAAFEALEGWVAGDDIKVNRRFTKRAGASCLFPALRWGYAASSSWGLKPPLSDSMRKDFQSSVDVLFQPDDPACPAKFEEHRAARNYREPRAVRPRKGKPLVMVVVDHECGSDCELMTMTLGKLPEAVVVGVNTAGVMQYIQPGFSVLPNTRLPYRVALGTSDAYGDNRSTDGIGLDVDVILDGESAWRKEGLLRLAEALRREQLR